MVYLPTLKSRGFNPQPVAGKIPKWADGKNYPNVVGTAAWNEFWKEQLHYCINGYDTGGIHISGIEYDWLNFKIISGVGSGFTYPDFVDLQHELWNAIEYCKKNNIVGIVIPKKRRFGFSFMATHLVDYGMHYINGYRFMIGAGLEKYTEKARSKLYTTYNNRPQELRLNTLKINDNEIILGWTEKTEQGFQDIEHAHGYFYTFGDNPKKAEGDYYNDVILDEIGDFANVCTTVTSITPSLKQGNIVKGLIISGGTGGNVLKGGVGLKQLWHEAESYGFMRFPIMGRRYHLPCVHGAKSLPDDVDKISTPNLDREYPDLKPEQLLGCEDVQEAQRLINIDLAIKLKNPNKKLYIEAKQQYPETVEDIFTSSGSNNFNTDLLFERLFALESGKNDEWKEYVLEFIKDKDGEVIVPYQVEARLPKDSDPLSIRVKIRHHPRPQIRDLDTGGCLLPGEKVMTDKALVNVEDVTKNNKLINENGEHVKINELLRHGVINEQVFEIKVSNTFRTTTFTSEHPILVSKHKLGYVSKNKYQRLGIKQRYHKFDFKYTKAENVIVGDWIKVPNIYKNKNDFDILSLWDEYTYHNNYTKIENPLNKPEFWWFIGLWLGDGWCASDGRITFAINAAEIEYADRLMAIIDKLFNRKAQIRNRNKNCLEISFHNEQLNKFLTNNFGKYAIKKRIPEWAKRVNDDFKYNLIQGYLNSDGCICIDKKRNLYNSKFVSINLELLESIQDILFALGYVSHIGKLRNAGERYFPGRTIACQIKECYQLAMGNNDTINFAKKICDENDPKLKKIDLNNIKLTDKRREDGCFIDNSLEYIYFQIRDITTSYYTGDVYNFNCETHTYMCHHITTHNCDGYNDDKTQTTKSQGAIVVLRSNNLLPEKDIPADQPRAEYPVCIYCDRPKRKELFWDIALKISIYYGLYKNMMCAAESDLVIKHLKDNGGKKYLSLRPRSFSSPDSKQMHEYGVKMDAYSKPRMIALMQSGVEDNAHELGPTVLVTDLIGYDEERIATDWDAADAYGLAKIRIADRKAKPRTDDMQEQDTRWNATEWVRGPNGYLVEKATTHKTGNELPDDFESLIQKINNGNKY